MRCRRGEGDGAQGRRTSGGATRSRGSARAAARTARVAGTCKSSWPCVGGGPAAPPPPSTPRARGLKPVVVAPAMGGQLMSKGVNVENYPGIVEASGGDIIKLMKRQALRFSATFEEEAVTKVDLSKRPFVITTNNSAFTAHSLVVATGADSRWLGVKGEEEYKGGGVSSCATCDGFLFKEQAGRRRRRRRHGDGGRARPRAHVRVGRAHPPARHVPRVQGAAAGGARARKITVMWNTTVKEFKGGRGRHARTPWSRRASTDPENVTELPPRRRSSPLATSPTRSSSRASSR